MASFPVKLFPDTFEWGCATSSFQIEGANTAHGRVPSIWDDFCAQPQRILDASDGSLACDHYHRYADDVALIAELGFKHYRFSLAWPRIVTADNRLNEKGLDFYKRLLDALEANDITPNATLFHWDLPSHLEGGWLARDTAYRFADYAALVARHLGDRLPRIATLNEPWTSAFLGYDMGIFAPGTKSRECALSAAHHHLLAHGLGTLAWRGEHSETMIGIVLNPEVCDPATRSAADVAAARLAEYERVECFLNPLFGREWPPELEQQMGARTNDRREGDLAICAQPLDFIGLNYYTRLLIRAPESPDEQSRGYGFTPPRAAPGKQLTDIGWEIYPPGFSRVIRDLSTRWPLPPIWITENGAADNTPVIDGRCDDTLRCDYLQAHLTELAKCVNDGIDIRGYYVWSLLDNFEWAHGYSQRFGVVHVDFSSQMRTRKKSALMFQAGLRDTEQS